MRWTSALMLLAALGCTGEQLGLPRIPVSATSPDGKLVAFVRNHPNVDPPSQSIWLGPNEGSAVRLKTLGPDSDWCNTIVWSSDSSTVSYLVQDARLITADTRTGRLVSEVWLTDWKGEYPPRHLVRELSLSPNGRQARFRMCDRVMGHVAYQHEAAGCGALQTMAIREAP